jgi:hypothetical protein
MALLTLTIGLQTEGLFRLSGATSEVMQLQKAFTHQGEHVDLTAYDIHSITSFIKKYLHHLPNAVVPANKHDDFLSLASLSKDQAIPMLIDLIALLPDRHSHLIHAILSLTSHIQHYADINMMNPEALAVVLAPVCTGIEKTIQILPKKPSKRNKKQQQDQEHPHRPQRIDTADIEQFIRTNARWTLLWKWMIEECDTFVSAISPQSLSPPHKDTITSIVGSPAPPPPIPSLLYCSSSLLATDHPGLYSHHPTSSMASLSPELPRAALKSRPSSPSMFTLCQKSSHGFLRRLASVSSLR